MVIPDDIEKIKRDVHNPMKWVEYDSTNVRINTNCFSHAIGSTVTSAMEYYRIGMLSDRKGIKETYKSSEEVKSLFLSDIAVLELDVKEISFSTQHMLSLVNTISKIELRENEYIVCLLVKNYGRNGVENIKDFHFIRYDADKGWSEKWKGNNVYLFKNIISEWPANWYDKLVGVFKISR